MSGQNQEYVLFEDHDGVVLGTIQGSSVVEAARVGEFGKFLARYAREHPGVKLLINFANVEYMSSSTLTELIRVKEIIEGSEGKLGLCGLRPDVLRVFQITNLDRHMNVQTDADIADAIQRFKEAG